MIGESQQEQHHSRCFIVTGVRHLLAAYL